MNQGNANMLACLFWKSTDQYFLTILDMQVAIINLQTWKGTYKIFYNKKNTLAFLPIRLIINGTSLKNVSSLGMIIGKALILNT